MCWAEGEAWVVESVHPPAVNADADRVRVAGAAAPAPSTHDHDQDDDERDDPGAGDAVEDPAALVLGEALPRRVALLRRLDAARRVWRAGLFRHGGRLYQALSRASAAKKSSTAARSEVTGQAGSGLEERPAVGLRAHARIEDRDHPAVGVRADQPPDALAQLKHGGWKRVLAEPVSAECVDPLAPRLDERIAGRGERQLVDHEQRQRLARGRRSPARRWRWRRAPSRPPSGSARAAARAAPRPGRAPRRGRARGCRPRSLRAPGRSW